MSFVAWWIYTSWTTGINWWWNLASVTCCWWVLREREPGDLRGQICSQHLPHLRIWSGAVTLGATTLRQRLEMVGLRKEGASGASRTNATLNPGHLQGWCGIDGAVSDSVHSPSLLSPDGAYAGVTWRSQGLAGLTTPSSFTTMLQVPVWMMRGLPLWPLCSLFVREK